MSCIAPPLLRAHALRLCYPQATVPAVNNLSLEVRKGEIFGLLGPNGAGKTTAISIMCTLRQPDQGEIEICGLNLRTRAGKVRPLIGVVPQDIALYTRLSVRENLHYFGTLHGLRGKTLHQRIEECLVFVGLEEHARRRVDMCSGGMKRRANLAAGIIHNPQLLFLDEPTVGIDAQSRHVILRNLEDLQHRGMSMLYTTHYMEEAQQLCSRVAVMDRGRVIAQGEPERLVQSNQCRDLEQVFLHLTGRELRD
ncbi:MAG: ABC transporter ATP-binding protein [Geobacteraceae bacterium]|nr:ABC transporter ATP-binding protein [Geobacteraceae bacterium]